MSIDRKDISLGYTSQDILNSLNQDLDSWQPEESNTTTANTKSSDWLSKLSNFAKKAGNVASQYSASKTPAVVNQPAVTARPAWLIPAAIGGAGLLLLLVLNKK